MAVHATQMLLGLLAFYFIGHTSGQFSSLNSINVNETSIGATVRNLMDGSLAFSLNLLRTLEEQERHNTDSSGVFFSPFSIWSALLVTYMGARGTTESELRSVLGTGPADKETVWGAYNSLVNWNANRQITPQKDESYQLANKIYFQSGTQVMDYIRELVQSDIDFVDFANSAAAANTINTWVESQTSNKIKDLVPAQAISSLTKMIIANAVYFKETWQLQFDPSRTRRSRFTLANRRQIFTDMMNAKGMYTYGISDELQCTGIELPYKGNELSMIVLLPFNRYYGISILAKRLTPDKLQNFLSEMYPREVLLSLPKFTLEDDFELAKVLSKMGLRSVFDPTRVDLSGFTGTRDLEVDAVYHKAFIDVNEQGTEAAGATSIIMSRTARPLGPAAFIANFPFIYLIKDNRSNVVLFMGTLQKPPEVNRK